MGMENLFQGLQMFQQGLQQYSTGKAISGATEAVNQLNMSELTDQQKRVEQMRLGNQLALQLGSLGAPVSQIQSATGVIKPEQFGSPQEMMMKGMLEGNKDLETQGQQMAAKLAAPGIAAEDRAYKRQLGLQDRKFNQELQLEMMKAKGKAAGDRLSIPGFEQIDPTVKLGETEQKDFRNSTVAIANVANSTKRLENLVNASGTEWFPSVSESGRKMETEYENLMLELKEFNKLGVLQKIDIEQLQKVLPNPTSFGSRTEPWKERLIQFKQQLNDKVTETAAAKGFKPKADFLQRIGLQEAAPSNSGLAAGERLAYPVNTQTGKRETWIVDSKGNPVRQFTGAE